MTIELYEMWRSEIYDRDLTSVGRIHDAMIQRGGGGGGAGETPFMFCYIIPVKSL